jgi:hypothetical protein
MKKLFWLYISLLLAAHLPAQSNAPARLAIIVESSDALPISDILTAELSRNPQITLLERNDIDKVYREQGLSAENRDYLKLGQILGADGLLLLGKIANTNQPSKGGPGGKKLPDDLTIRLIAVRPGVLLAGERMSWPDDVPQWATGFVTHLQPLLPKISVLIQDAIPISIENLRAPVPSPEFQDLEHQLTALTIERLTRQRQFFVLERRKMQLLTSEKSLKGLGDSPFWNGSYLLDGTIDRNGYSQTEVTISGRLVPPKGGAPVEFEITGSRSNLAAVVDQLADKIAQNLKLNSVAVSWNPADEARAYFDEAKWALRWGMSDEAQAASESAWALGKQDLDCALTRIEAYRVDIPQVWSAHVQSFLHGKKVGMSVDDPPNPEDIDRSLHLLEMYNDFAHTSAEPPKLNSPYYLLGCDVLDRATGILRHYHFHPDSQKPVSDKLRDLRLLARTIVAWLSQSPSVRDTYWLGGRIPNQDEVYHNFSEYLDPVYHKRQNLFDFELQWGSLWQERPEDCLAIYRQLMSNPLFVCIHQDFWFRTADDPRLTAWTPEDRTRLPQVWTNFLADLENSTNAFWGMEARAVELADAIREREKIDTYVTDTELYRRNATEEEFKRYRAEWDQKMEQAGVDLFGFAITNYERIVAGRDELLYLDWGLGEYFERDRIVTPTEEKLESDFHSTYALRLRTLHDTFVSQNSERLKEKENLPKFEKQKQYLTSFTPYDFNTFNQLFSSLDVYSKQQAAELETLAELYCSNMLAGTEGIAKSRAKSNAGWIEFALEKRLKQTVNPPQPAVASAVIPTKPPPPSKPAVATNISSPKISSLTNFLAPTFLAFPKEQFPATNFAEATIFAHRLRGDSLVLGVQYRDEREVYSPGVVNYHSVFREAVAIWRANDSWEIIPSVQTAQTEEDTHAWKYAFIESQFGSPHPTLFVELLNNVVYVSDWDAIREYDLNRHQWQELPFPGQSRAQLFAVKNHLYASSLESIVEIAPDGTSARILASTRRRPAASVLDSRPSLGDPILFEGPGDAPYVALDRDIFAWNGTDWQQVMTTVTNRQPPEVFGDAAFLRSSRMLHTDAYAPLRKALRGLSPADFPAAMDGTNIYYFTVESSPGYIQPGTPLSEKNGRHADLVCVTAEFPSPLTIPLKFQSDQGPVPRIPWRTTVWVACSSKFLFIGAPTMPGVWTVPKSEIRAEIQRQIRINPQVHEPAS